MKALLLIALLALGAPAFAQYPFAIGSESLDQGFAIAATQDGGSVVVGEFRQSADFDPGPGTHVLTANGTRDAFVASYDANGALRWAFHVGGPGVDGAHGVTVDWAGNVYVVGTFRESADFDPGEEEHVLTSHGQTDAFLASYTASGELRWAIHVGGEDYDQGNALTLAPYNAVCATGSFQGTADFDPGEEEAVFTSAGSYDLWVACYDADDASLIWAHGAGGPGAFDRGWAITSDYEGLYVTGDFTGTTQFDPAGEAEPLTAKGPNDLFVAAYSPAGDYRWAHRAGGAANDVGNRGDGIAVVDFDGYAVVYVTGDILGVADFPSGEVLDVGDVRTPFLAAISADGAPLAAFAFPATGPGRGTGLAVIGPVGPPLFWRMIMTGYFEGTMDLSAAGGTTITSAGGRSAFALVLSPDLQSFFLDESHVLGGPANDQAYGVAATDAGHVFVTGSFGGTGTFFLEPLTATGARDVFVARHTIDLPSSAEEHTASGAGGPALALAGPNPFAGSTTVAVRARQPGPVAVAVFDVLGRRVAVLQDRVMAPDEEAVLPLPPLAPGVYVVRAVDASGASAVRVTRVR